MGDDASLGHTTPCARRLPLALVLLHVLLAAQQPSYTDAGASNRVPDSWQQPSSTSAGAHGSASHAAWSMGSLGSLASRQLLGTSPKARVLVVNDIPGHFEVLAGVLHTLSTLDIKPHVLYVGAPNIPVTWGLLGWLGEEPTPEWDRLPLTWPQTASTTSKAEGAEAAQQVVSNLDTKIAMWHPMRMLGPVAGAGLSADLVVCVSAELAPDVCREVVDAVKPHQLAVILHRADALSLNAKVLTIYNRTEMFALAPHVARMSETKMRVKVGWALPTAPLQPKRGECMRLSCLDGFTVQGALRRYRNKNGSGYTRNYLQLWSRLLELKTDTSSTTPNNNQQQGAQQGGQQGGQGGKGAQQGGQGGGGGGGGATAIVPAVRVAVLGKGERAALGIPVELQQDVTYHSRLPYPEFWGRIHRSLALVPSLGHAEYYLSRITSTILASLITSTPIIADKRLMDAYEFLGPEHVFMREEDEDEAAAMYRIAAMPEAEVLARRAALVKLRASLNARSRDMFAHWLEKTPA